MHPQLPRTLLGSLYHRFIGSISKRIEMQYFILDLMQFSPEKRILHRFNSLKCTTGFILKTHMQESSALRSVLCEIMKIWALTGSKTQRGGSKGEESGCHWRTWSTTECALHSVWIWLTLMEVSSLGLSRNYHPVMLKTFLMLFKKTPILYSPMRCRERRWMWNISNTNWYILRQRTRGHFIIDCKPVEAQLQGDFS